MKIMTAVNWLDSPEGQRWSRGRHNEIQRGIDRGVFGETKLDDEACPMDTGRAFRDRARWEAEFGPSF